MKNKKIIFIIIGIIIVTGLIITIIFLNNNKNKKYSFDEAYSNSELKEDNNSYVLDLRIYGTYQKVGFNKIIRIDNYNNEKYLITKIDSETEKKYKIDDSKNYEYIEDEYKEIDKISSYTNPEIYKMVLKDATNKKDIKRKDDYQRYEFKISKEKMQEVLADTDLIMNVNKDAKGEIWIDKNGQIVKVYYYIDQLTIFASYLSYNKLQQDSFN